MKQCHKFFKIAAMSAILATALAASSAIAGSGTVSFVATINTSEFLLPADNCDSKIGGIGVGVGTTNLFTKKPETQTTKAVLSSFDCVSQDQYGFIFGPGKFSLTGPGGDTIFATYSGTLGFHHFDAVSNLPVFKFNDGTIFNIVGGTGVYAKAAGAGTISGTETINQAAGTAQGSLVATGKIIY